MIRRIIRDNRLVNGVVRNLIRFAGRFFNRMEWIENRYRVYGTVTLCLEGVKFKMHSLADDHIVNELFYHRDYENDEFRWIKFITARSHCFVDVGANTGIYSVFAASANPKLHVFCMEPHPGNFSRLQTNILANHLINITPMPVAAGATSGSLQFTIPFDAGVSTTSSANEAFASNFHKIRQRNIEVPQVSLDEIGLELTSRDLLKIDVEYYELQVLHGCRRILAETRPLLLLEVLQYERLIQQFPEMKGKIQEDHASRILEFLNTFGYTPYSMNKSELIRCDDVKAASTRNFLFMPRHEKHVSMQQMP